MSTEQTEADEAEQEVHEVRRNARAWRTREEALEADLLVQSREKPDDEPGDGPRCPVCGLPLRAASAEHGLSDAALWCGYCGEY